jgi:hypothetical protein
MHNAYGKPCTPQLTAVAFMQSWQTVEEGITVQPDSTQPPHRIGKVEISKSFEFFLRREDRFRESGSETEKNKAAHEWSFGLHRVQNPEFDMQNKL